MDKKKMKPYVAAILLIVLYVAEIFWLSDILGANLGLAGTEVPFVSVAMYIMYGGAVPLLIYVGNYLIHSGETGYENGLFPRKKQKILIILILVSLGMFLLGAVLLGISVVRNMSYYMY